MSKKTKKHRRKGVMFCPDHTLDRHHKYCNPLKGIYGLVEV